MKVLKLGYPTPGKVKPFVFYLLAVLFVPAMIGLVLAGDLTRVSIAENVQIDDESILLGKIATIEGGDPMVIRELSRIVVGRAPLAGGSRNIKDSLIKQRIKQHGVDFGELILQIPPQIVVSRSFIEIEIDKLKELVSDHISKNFLPQNKNARIKDIRITENLRLPGGRISYDVIAPRNRDLVGKVPFSIKFKVNGNFYKRIWATVTIEAFAEVVVTQKPLGRHKPITEDDIRLVKMDLADLPSDVITDPEAVLGKRTRRAIGAKTVLRAKLVELPPLVKRGDVVVIIAETQGFRITTLGQVKKKGALGDRIPVINFDSKKVLYARVLDSNTVKVDF